jgi:hypothetical protein
MEVWKAKEKVKQCSERKCGAGVAMKMQKVFELS